MGHLCEGRCLEYMGEVCQDGNGGMGRCTAIGVGVVRRDPWGNLRSIMGKVECRGTIKWGTAESIGKGIYTSMLNKQKIMNLQKLLFRTIGM